MNPYRALTDIPHLVAAARDLATRLAFANSCTDETGRLLRVLAGTVVGGRIGETGSGCGAGAAWIATALHPSTTLITVERDPVRAAAVRDLFAPLPNVRTLHDDWSALLAHGPFDLLFLDGGGNLKGTMDGQPPDEHDVARALAAVRPGGLILLDDLTPEADWPPEWRGRPDPTRAFWLNDPRVLATELLVNPRGGPAAAVILATRLH